MDFKKNGIQRYCEEFSDSERFITQTLEKLDAKIATLIRTGQAPHALTVRDQMELVNSALHSMEGKVESIEIFEGLPDVNLREQYDQQVQTLRRVGVLAPHEFTFGTQSITLDAFKGKDGRYYPVPSYEQIFERTIDAAEILKEKVPQGFTKLVLVPFASSIKDLADCYNTQLKRRAQAGVLQRGEFDSARSAKKKTEPIHPRIRRGDDFFTIHLSIAQEADQRYPIIGRNRNQTEFKTKEDLLHEKPIQYTSPWFPQLGWHILFVEDHMNTLRRGRRRTMGGRTQFDSGGSPSEHLSNLVDEHFVADYHLDHEQWMDVETWLAFALAELEQKNVVVDHLDGGPGTMILGTYDEQRERYYGAWSELDKEMALNPADRLHLPSQVFQIEDDFTSTDLAPRTVVHI
jgi:hypothetical protein